MVSATENTEGNDINDTDEEDRLSGEKMIHLNHAGASPSPDSVLNCVIDHMKLEQQLGGYSAANKVKEDLDNVYSSLGKLLHITNYRKEIALVESATVGWTRLFYAMVQYQDLRIDRNDHDDDDVSLQQKKKRFILVSEAEYAANIVAICQWCKETHHHYDWKVLSIPSTINPDGSSSGILNITTFQEMLSGQYVLNKATSEFLNPTHIALVCITHIPTNSGIINPVYELGELVSFYNTETLLAEIDESDDALDENSELLATVSSMPNILYLVDACQSVGQMDVNTREMRCHGLTGTGRKFLRGPRGTGFLYVNYDVAQELIPNHIDHASAPVVAVPNEYSGNSNETNNGIEDLISIKYQDGAKRFEFWESNIANKLGLGEAVRHAMTIGLDKIDSQCSSLSNKLRQILRTKKKLHVHHDNIIQCSCGIVTFYVDGIPSSLIKERLSSSEDRCLFFDDESCITKFDVSLVPATSTPLDSAMTDVPDLLRVSFSYTNTINDVELFCNALDDIIIDEMNIFEDEEKEEYRVVKTKKWNKQEGL